MKKIALTLLAILIVPAFAMAQNASKKATWLVIPPVAFGSVGAGYSTFATLTKPIDMFDIVNLTNANIICTDDTSSAGGDKWPIPAGSAFSPPLGETFTYMNSVISCKRESAAPTSGSVYINAGY